MHAPRPHWAHFSLEPFKLPTGVKDVLHERARRILASTDDKLSPSPSPALFESITDELLVVASDAVAAAATEAQAKPSGKAKYRLLAWLVADARGADTPLDKALAETVGKRLDRQAAAVRTATAHAVQLAESARAAARSAAASDVTLQATLQATLAGIDADEQAAVGRPRSEVYVGFHELDALLPGTARYEPPLPLDLPSELSPKWQLVKDREDGIFFPIFCQPRTEQESKSGPIPQDLVSLLGPDATTQLREEYGGRGYEGPDWWSMGVPNLVKLLRANLAESEKWRAEDELLMRADKLLMSVEKRRTSEAEEATAEAEEEIQELKKQLQEAKGREDALLGVIDRCRWGESAECWKVQAGKRPRSCE